MAKRGRPNVYERGGVPNEKALSDNLCPNYSERGKVNSWYQSIGLYRAVQAHNKEPIPGLHKITNHPGCILEQLGRMQEQDQLPLDLVEQYARLAVNLINEGWKQKDVAQFLRNCRKEYK